MNDTNFAKALIYAEYFGSKHDTRLPYLGYTFGARDTSKSAGHYCLECDGEASRPAYIRKEIKHLPGCGYLHYRRAVVAAKELLAQVDQKADTP